MHILTRLPRTMTLAQVVEMTKTSTSGWLKTKGLNDFAWQAGYGASLVGANDSERVVRYIQSQEQHHHKSGYQDELMVMMTEAGIEVDERYVWE